MTRETFEHGLGKSEARALLDAEAVRYAEQYGLTVKWKGDTWSGKRLGVTVVARVAERRVDVAVDAWAGEKKIMKAILQKLRQRLR